MVNRVCLLTGDFNNSGDYLIKFKTQKLFEHFLPDAELLFINRNKPFNDKLELINASDFLVIAGGPALFNNFSHAMNLDNIADDISVPIVFFGVGIGGAQVDHKDFYFNFTKNSKKILETSRESGYLSSCRDFKTLLYLKNAGFDNFRFTGCPVLYEPDKTPQYKRFSYKDIKKIVFSTLPPSLNKKIYTQQIGLIKKLRNFFNHAKIQVAFHHSKGSGNIIDKYGENSWGGGKSFKLYDGFIKKLDELGILSVDISESEKKFIDLYNGSDLHVGYRVHAHVYMTSIGKNSILIVSDGRGDAMSEVIFGKSFYAFKECYTKTALGKLYYKRTYNKYLYEEIIRHLDLCNSKNLYTNITDPSYYNHMRDFFAQFS